LIFYIVELIKLSAVRGVRENQIEPYVYMV